ncbi:MAG: PEP-CTERM sorting domain-containing protein [Marinobacter sp.]|uniref:PEP-CTERM sorting domain-containing protein n=1 Tax=Marinobacter sp. TaxID=50741 RepID=UPI00299F3BCC|nr:PEP-CTERM sorting domain-containing protein [Marinobacter sp.]MDX1756401.1 PEP-CTERM sorting domain-containing protein [Marinobacter sp.]
MTPLKPTRKVVGGIALAAYLLGNQALAASVLCSTDPTKNRLSVDDSQVSACLASGTGNLTGELHNDLFLNSSAGADYEPAGKQPSFDNPFNIAYSQTGEAGSWSFDSSFWNTYNSGAIAFKFGTGNQPDEWFVYSLQLGMTGGDWAFINEYGRGGGLSHVNLYGASPVPVPEPGTLALLGLGILGVAGRKRRQQQQ